MMSLLICLRKKVKINWSPSKKINKNGLFLHRKLMLKMLWKRRKLHLRNVYSILDRSSGHSVWARKETKRRWTSATRIIITIQHRSTKSFITSINCISSTSHIISYANIISNSNFTLLCFIVPSKQYRTINC